MQSKNALGNLKNRYVAVLKKCNLINVFGSLAVVGMLTMGASSVFAATATSDIGADVNASGDNVTIAVGTAGTDYFGGKAESNNRIAGVDGGNATASGNTLTITAGSADRVIGGHSASSAIHSGNGKNATAENNTVTLSVGATAQQVIGGQVYSGTDYGGGTSGDVKANNNTVHIHGTVTSFVRGGEIIEGSGTASYNKIYVYDGATVGELNAALLAGSSRGEYNFISLEGDITLTGEFLSGTYTQGGPIGLSPVGFTGNTLLLDRYANTTRAKNVVAFETYNFILPANTVANSIVFSATNVYLGNDQGAAATKFASIGSVSIDSGHKLNKNEMVVLIDSTNPIDGVIANDGLKVTSDATAFTQQEWEINQNSTNTQITATFLSEDLTTDPNPNPNPNPDTDSGSNTGSGSSGGSGTLAGAVVEAQTGASTAAIKSANQHFASVALPAAQSASSDMAIAQLDSEQGFSAGSMQSRKSTWAPFASVYGGYSSYESDAKTDVTSVSLMGGLAHTSYFNSGALLVGGFFETGTGSYDSTASSGGARIDSDGNLTYYGAGLFGRYDFNTENGTPYIEASARIGAIESDFDTNDIIDPNTGLGISYDTNATYYGMHIGAGYIYEINPQWEVDLSAKYFWTHHDSIDKTIGGNRFEFNSIDSHIVRLGAKVSYDALDNDTYSFSPYAGLAYEYEFDSNASATVDNIPVPSESDLRGSTGVLELGAEYKHVNGFSFSAGVEGSLGKRESIGGKIEFKYKF